ncbi:uncharacterized protein BDV17DRAFT_293660 [Aspergillus undulatus]|uniref:uncharacterized protein n=1 Tax=Aspergillus undulatus TaxID=1810928 RepID=UPI003CCE1AEA
MSQNKPESVYITQAMELVCCVTTLEFSVCLKGIKVGGHDSLPPASTFFFFFLLLLFPFLSISSVSGPDEAILRINTRLRPQPQPAEPTTASQPEASAPLAESSANKLAELSLSNPEQGRTTPAVVPAHDAPSPHDDTFCPVVALSKFPYQHIHGDLMLKVASGFFDRGQFWERPWDLYYIHATPRLGGRPIILVPTTQARRFFRDINKALQCSLALPPDEEKGFVLKFNRDGFPQPTFLGHTDSRTVKDRLEATIPQTDVQRIRPGEMDEQFMAYEKMMEAAVSAAKSKSKSKFKAKKQRLRIQHDIDIRDTIKRTQCYLGLRADSSDLIDYKWDQVPDPESPRLAADSPVPYPFWREPVFISVDVEVNERCHNRVTEVGISALDTRDIVGVAPGPKGENWQAQIQSRHLRVQEYEHHVNQLYVRGCPDKFEFGASELVSADNVPLSVQDFFASPSFFDGPDKKRRPLVLVGHNLESDIQYLRLSGIHIIDDSAGASKFDDHIDTATCFQMIRGETEPRSLGAIVGELGMTGWNLHNAGNDARYTMQVLVAMMITDRIGTDHSSTPLKPVSNDSAKARPHICVDLSDSNEEA